jgi:DNA-binding MarR family transcriptional regulator
LGLLRKQGWVQAKRGKDRRERVFSLTRAGKQRLAITQPYWEQAERRLRRGLGDKGWKKMKEAVTLLTDAALDA